MQNLHDWQNFAIILFLGIHKIVFQLKPFFGYKSLWTVKNLMPVHCRLNW